MKTITSPVEGFDFIRAYTQYADVLEAPREMHELVAMQLLATMLNMKNVTIPQGSLRHSLDLWQVLLSGSGFGRSTLVTMTDPIIAEAGIIDFYRNETWGSSQGLQQQISLHPSGLYVWGELSETLKRLNDPRFAGAKAWVTDRYDNFKTPASIIYRATGKNSDTPPIEFSQPPRINILATSSLEWFFNNLAPEDSAGGFLPRWLLFAVDNSGKIVPTPRFADQNLVRPLADHLRNASLLQGEADLSVIRRAYKSWYHEKTKLFRNQPNKALADAYFRRHRVHILKLAVIFEVSSSLSLKVSKSSWRRAVRMARKLEETIFRLLPTGMSGTGYLLQQMADIVRAAGPEGIPKSRLTRAFQHYRWYERESTIATLMGTDVVSRFRRPTSGRPAVMLVHSDYLTEHQNNYPEDKQT